MEKFYFMMKRSSKILFCSILILFSSSLPALADDCDFTVTANVVPATCDGSGIIHASVSGPDVAYLDLTTAQYALTSADGGSNIDFSSNGGSFYSLPSANYRLFIRAFCSKSNTTVTKQSISVQVGGTYIIPNMYVQRADIKASLSCGATGRIPLKFFDGSKAGYKIMITGHPAAYKGEKEFVQPTETTGTSAFWLTDLPVGTYTLTLQDSCGYTIPGLEAIVPSTSVDFPTLSSPTLITSTTTITDCDSINVNVNFSSTSSNMPTGYGSVDLAPFYEIVYTLGDNPTEYVADILSVSSGVFRTTIRLHGHRYEEFYAAKGIFAAGGKNIYVKLRIKNTTCTSNTVPLTFSRPYAYLYENNRCGEVDLTTSITGYACMPMRVKIYDADTDALINTVSVTTKNNASLGTLPHGPRKYKFIFESSDGSQWTQQLGIGTNSSYDFSVYTFNPNYFCRLTYSNLTCTNFTLLGGIASGSGVLPADCYPLVAKVYNATTNALLNTVDITADITYSRTVELGSYPVGSYKVIFSSPSAGLSWSTSSESGSNGTAGNLASAPVYTINRIQQLGAKATARTQASCDPDNILAYIYLNATASPGNTSTTSFRTGTLIEAVSAPSGQALATPFTVTTTNMSYFYPYSPRTSPSSSTYVNLKAGTYTFRVTDPTCNDVTIVSVDVVAPVIPSPKSYSVYSGSAYSCAQNQMRNPRIYLPNSGYFSNKTRIQYLEGPDANAVIHKDVTIPSANYAQTFYPFSINYNSDGGNYYTNSVTPGTYVFEITDPEACNAKSRVSIVVDYPYQIEQYPVPAPVYKCDYVELYPTVGSVRQNTTVTNKLWYKIIEARNPNGSNMSTNDYPRNVIQEGAAFTLAKNGTYTIQMQLSSSTNTCGITTFDFVYEQKLPKLDYANSSSYVCAGASVGYLNLKAYGGFGSGPYEFEILGSNPVQKNMTGKFTYGAPGERLMIRVTDYSAEAAALGCHPYFDQPVDMTDLGDASVTYTSAEDGIFCEDGTIDLNCITLGESIDYIWTYPDGTVVNEQYPIIPDAKPSHSGRYYVIINPEQCGDTMRDSLDITVIAKPEPPTLTTYIEKCYNSGTYKYMTETGAVASPGNTLLWYNYDGTVMTVTSTTTFNTNVYYTRDYWVSQVNNTTGCESDKVKFTVHILEAPIAPAIDANYDAACYMDSATIYLPNTDAGYRYSMYNSSSGGTPIISKQGNGGTLSFKVEVTSSYTVYYFSTEDMVTGCGSSGRSQIYIYPDESSATVDDITADDVTICTQTTATLTASSAVSDPVFRWYAGNSHSSALLGTGPTYETPVLTSTSTDKTYTYYVSVEGTDVCENMPSNRKPVRVIVTPGPSGSANITAANQTICYGDSTIITASVSSEFNNPVFYWYTSQTATEPIFIGDRFETPAITGSTTYYIAFKEEGGCETPINLRKTVTISVNSRITTSLSPSSICIGATSTLTPATSAGTWVSNNPAVATVSSRTATGISAGTVKFIYTRTSDGCTAESPVLTVKPTPGIYNVPASVCINETAQVTGSPEGGTWSTGSSTYLTVSSDGVIKGVRAGSTNVRYTVNGCYIETPVTIKSNATATINVSGTTNICTGNTVTLTASTASITNPVFRWYETSTGGSPIYEGNTFTTPVLTSAGNKSYYITVSNDTYCESVNRKSFTITVTAPVSGVIAGNQNVCAGSAAATITSQSLPSGISGGTWYYEWQYSTDNGLTWTSIFSGGSGTTYSPGTITQTTQYRRKEVNGTCETYSNVVTKTVNALPEVSIDKSSICVNETATISSQSAGTWTSLVTGVATVTSEGIVTGKSDGTTIIRFTESATGCTAAVLLAVKALPTVSINRTEMCIGTTASLLPTGSNGTWISNNTDVATISGTSTANGKAPGKVTFTYTANSSGCSATTPELTVKALYTGTINISGTTTICEGTTTKLTASASGVTSPVYTWYETAYGTNSVYTGNTFDVPVTLAAGTKKYYVTVSGADYCENATRKEVTLTITPSVVPSVNIIASPATVCAGAAVTYTATPVNGGASPSYQWKVNGTNVGTNSTTYSYTPANGDRITCVMTSNASCASPGIATSNIITMAVNALPVPTITPATSSVCVDGSDTYTTETGMTDYAWVVSGVSGTDYTITAGGTGSSNTITIKWLKAGNQTVAVNYKNTAGCTGASAASVAVIVNALPATPTFTSSSAAVCTNGNGTYTTQGGMTDYVWVISGVSGTDYAIVSGGTTSSNTTIIKWLRPGSYTVSVNYKNASGCSAVAGATASVTVSALPALPVHTIDCSQGFGKAVVTITSPLGTGYQYALNNGTYQSAVSFNNVANGTYTLKVKNAEGCEVTGSSFQVNCGCAGRPELSIESSAESTCGTAAVTISGNTFGGSATQATITHNGGGTLNSALVTSSPFNIVYTPAASDAGKTILISIVTDNPSGAPCEAATGTISIAVNDLPAAPTFTSSSTSACINADGTYTTQAGMTNYTWTVSGTAGTDYTIVSGGSSSSNTTIITWLRFGSYTVSVNYEDASGCSAAVAATANVTVSGPPPLPVSMNGGCSFGKGSIIVISPIDPDYQYALNDGAYQSSPSFDNLVSGLYTAKVKDGAGCEAIGNAISVLCAACVSELSLKSSSVSTCGTSAVTISGNTFGRGATQASISHNGNGTLNNALVTSSPFDIIYTPAASDVGKTIVISVVANNPSEPQCGEATGTINITVNALPEPDFTSSSTSVCAGSNGTYATQAGMNNYDWTISGTSGTDYTIIDGASSTSNTATIKWLKSGSYTVSVNYTNASGCIAATSAIASVTVNSLAKPVHTVVCSPGVENATITVTSPTGAGYQYALNDGAYQTAVSFDNIADGTYTLKVKNAEGCETTGSNFVVNCGCVGLPDLKWTTNNPVFTYHIAGDSLTISAEVTNIGDTKIGTPVYFTLYDTSVGTGNILGTGICDITILPGETKTTSFKIENFKNQFPTAVNLALRLNDNGAVFPYQPECDDSDSVRLGNIYDFRTKANQYVACPDAKVKIEMVPETGITFYWYDVATGGTAFAGPKDTCTIVKDSSPLQTYWVEPRQGSTVFSRVEVVIALSASCGGSELVDCAVNGTLLFREDFGGNNTTDARIATKANGLPAGTTDYVQRVNDDSGTVNGAYWLLKSYRGSTPTAWQKYFSDHTNPNDLTRGYMFLVDADTQPGMFYKTTLSGLCPGVKRFYFSAWLVNMVYQGASQNHDPSLRFDLEDKDGNLLASYYTGLIQRDVNGNPGSNASNPNTKATWKQYGFAFSIPSDDEEITLKLYNNTLGSNGNDLAMDDIEIHLCLPEVEANVDNVCGANITNLTATYTDDGSITNHGTLPLNGYWIKSYTDDINDNSLWEKVEESEVVSNIGEMTIHSLFTTVPENADTVYYRFVTGSPLTVDNPYCRATSSIMVVFERFQPTLDIRDTIVCVNETIDLYTLVGNLQYGVTDSLKFSTVNGDNFDTGLIANPSSYLVPADQTIYVKVQNEYLCLNDMTSNAIQISTTIPSVNITAPVDYETIICEGGSVTLKGTYADNGILGNNISFRWEHNPTGDIDNPDAWNAVAGSTNTSNDGTVTEALSAYPVSNFTVADSGYYRLVVINSAGSFANDNCRATSDLRRLILKPVSTIDNIIAVADSTVCLGASVDLTGLVSATDLTNPVFYWYTTLNGSTTLPSTTVTPAVGTHTYYVAVSGDEHCEGLPDANGRVPLNITVNPLLTPSISISTPSVSVCPGNLATFTSVATSAGTSPVYQWKVNGTNAGTNSNEFSYIPSDGDVVTCMLTSSEACADPKSVTSNAVTIAITTTTIPAIDIESDPVSPICAGTSVSFSSTIANGGTSPVYDWKVNGTSVGSNATYAYTPANGDVITCTLTSNDLCASTPTAISDPITMLVKEFATVANLITRDTTICNGNSVDLSDRVKSTGVTNPVYKWYTTQTGSVLVNPVTVTPSVGTHSYYVSVSGDNLCEGAADATGRQTVNVTVNPLSTVANMITRDTIICNGNSIDLNDRVKSTGITNPVYKWYAAVDATSPLPSATVTPPIGNTTYYVAVEGDGICEGEANDTGRKEVTVTVNALSTVDNLITQDASTCGTGTIDLSELVSSTGVAEPVYKWYTTIDGTTPLPSTIVSPSGAVTYYVSVSGDNLCEGEANGTGRKAVNISMYPYATPAMISVTGTSICSGDIATLTASAAGVDNPVFNWYKTASGNTLRYTGNPFVTPALLADTTYYVTVSGDNYCEGTTRAVVDVEVTCVTLAGTVFPFVYSNEPELDTLFKVTVGLYEVPAKGVFDPVEAVLSSTPLYETRAEYYDGSFYVPGTPKHPGQLGFINSPGEPVRWDKFGHSMNPNTNYDPVSGPGDVPVRPVGVYLFKGVQVNKDYILKIEREGYLTRFAKITVTSDGYLGHRLIIPGDINEDLEVMLNDISSMNNKYSDFGMLKYNPRYDLNGNGIIDLQDISLANFYRNFYFELYEESWNWVKEY